MPIESQRISLCRFLHTLAEEKNISLADLSQATGITLSELGSILKGLKSPTVDQLITVANELDMQLTFHQTIPFAHKKAAGQVR